MTQQECKEKWEALRQDFMARIDAIDAETPWSESEPEWWLHMMAARKAASILGASNGKTRA